MRAAVKTLWSMAIAVAMLAILQPCSAVAGSYVVTACSPSRSPGLWAPVNTFPASYTIGNLCGGPEIGPLDGGDEGGLYAEDILGSPTNMPDGSSVGWTFTAPVGTTISGIRYYRTLAAHGDRDIMAGLITAEGAVLEQCTIEIPFGSPIDCYKPNDQAPSVFTHLSTGGLFVGVMCRVVVPGTGGCGAGSTIHRARAVLYSARVTLAENSLPAATNVAGALWGGGVVWGAVPVTFVATDPSGIMRGLVRMDGGIALATLSPACDFSLAQPCAQVPAGSLSVDTRRLPDGPHTFSLVVTDAAGNVQTVFSPSVVVDNSGPPAPMALTAMAAGPDAVAVAWRNPPSVPVAVVGGRVQVCAASCAREVAVGPGGSARVAVPGPGAYTVRLWLPDAQGRGGPHNAASTTVTVPAAASAPCGHRSRR
jgi:hypothetical protein